MGNKKPKLGIAIAPSLKFLEAALPLFAEEKIEIIEWSFDTLKDAADEPVWLSLLLKEYGEKNRLLGHGVFYALLDANWSSRQENWLKKVRQETLSHKYCQISEHFGLMSSANAHSGFPLPIPLSNPVLQIGIDRLKRLQATAQVDVGIENLALTANVADILEQGEFLFKLVNPVNGFIILDLHNIYCQSENFNIDMMTIIKSYPLSLVKELHISGGSWDTDPTLSRKIRRDTHEGRIPEVILEILPEVLKICPFLAFIIFEKIEDSFLTEKDGIDFRADFQKIREIIDATSFSVTPKEKKQVAIILGPPVIDVELLQAQVALRESIALDTYQTNSEWDKDMWKVATKLYEKWNN
ncbi:DUF692 family multinuclear iron-containing protein [Cellulophaga sp. Z1A5H]|uniref:multinuclear nonheme iron-dependent oxidase n=1 Tax=Cellulophaga sp. Z1A5H TaxID=2687291 RepID=UPI0013FDCB4E|nr:DUF692 family multinuclear iron-containing protein [Cellulophaga sp. Z1A5H]